MEPEGQAARERLFVTHSFLVALARGVIHTLARPAQDPDPGTLLRDGFVAWILKTTPGRRWAREFLENVHAYEWRRQRGDVMRPLYEQFVDEKDRQDFGEYYTPDWLAELMVSELLDDAWCEEAVEAAIIAAQDPTALNGIGVLDPTCGSGTFLYHAVRRILRSDALARQSLNRSAQAAVVARLVNGIDVHPVAGEIARATVLRALPVEPPEGLSAVRVYEGDALLIRSDDETSLFRPGNGELQFRTTRGTSVYLPRSFVTHHSFVDNLRRLVAAATNDRPLPTDIRNSVVEADRKLLDAARDTFVEVIRKEGNSVWTWYIANTTGPFLLAERKVNRIVANPPWVSMAGIQAQGRKRALEEFAKRLDLWTGGKNAPHFDIAQLFVKHCRDLYLANDNDPAGWLVKLAALKSGGWQRFREAHSHVLAQSLDLEKIQPFGGGDARRCCVLFERRPSRLHRDQVPRLVARGGVKKPTPEMPLREALPRLGIGEAPAAFSQKPSEYSVSVFRQGATIVPKVLVIAEKTETISGANTIKVTTARSDKKPWSTVEVQSGMIPASWLRPLLTSNDLFVFATASKLVQAIIPINKHGQMQIASEPAQEFWVELERVYDEFRGSGKSTPTTLKAQIDFNQKLSRQLAADKGSGKTLVLYPKSGDLMRAARTFPGAAVIDHTVYYFPANDEDEAAFLVGLLNAPGLSRAFKEARTSGRDFHKSPWRFVPVPRYDPANGRHQEIVRLTQLAEDTADRCLDENAHRRGQVATSGRIRAALTENRLSEQLDETAAKILPDHIDKH